MNWAAFPQGKIGPPHPPVANRRFFPKSPNVRHWPCGQVLDYPFLDGVTPPEDKLDPRSIMPAWRIDAFNVLYAGVPENLENPLLSPVMAAPEALEGLQPALTLIAGLDPLRFKAQRYAGQRRLRRHGIRCALRLRSQHPQDLRTPQCSFQGSFDRHHCLVAG